MSKAVATPVPQYEFWGNITGNDMLKCYTWDGYAYACDKFTEEIHSAMRLRMGYYMELRRAEDGSVIARCSTYAVAAPDG